MAILQNTLIGRAKGSIGGVTFSTWKGKNVGKSKPVSVANPDTPKQQAQRSALRQVVAIFRQIPALIDAGYNKLAIGKSAYNAFASQALKNGFDTSVPPTATLQEALILISKGSVGITPVESFTAGATADSVNFTWDGTITPIGGSSTDRPLFVVYNETKNLWEGKISTGDRVHGTGGFQPTAGFLTAGDTVMGYLGFQNITTGEVSDSVNTFITVSA